MRKRSWSVARVVIGLASGVLSAIVVKAQTPVLHTVSTDASLHRVHSVKSGGAHLHVLEWGRGARTVVLLPGYSLTAHVFDEVGPLLADSFHVFVLTPRGFGESDAPDSSSYTVATLVQDLRTIMDSLGVRRAIVVGHSLSGTTAAAFALQFPERVARLILLDAFPYAAAMQGDSVMSLDPVATPAFRGDTTYDAVAQYLATYRFVPWSQAFENDLRVKPLGREGERRRTLTAAYVADQWKNAPDLSRLTMPSLEVCAVASVKSEYPWLRRRGTLYVRAERYVRQTLLPFNERMCRRYSDSVPHGEVERVEGSHYLFFSQPATTARIVRRFALQGVEHVH